MRPYAAIIKNARENLGLSATEVANAIGLNYYHYVGLEHRDDKIKTTFPLTALCKLLLVLKLDPFEFFAVPREFVSQNEKGSPLAQVQERLRERMKRTQAQGNPPKDDPGLKLAFLVDNPDELAEGPLGAIYYAAWITGVPCFNIFLEIFNKTKATFSFPDK